jgi:hypothetical protein
MTGKRGPVAVLAIGVRQQSAYQRKTLVGEAQAAHGIRACDELHPGGRHLEDVRSAGRVEHVRPLEETRECLAVPAIADEAEAARLGDVAHAAAPATKGQVQGHALHQTGWLRRRRVGYRFHGHVKTIARWREAEKLRRTDDFPSMSPAQRAPKRRLHR